jgi:sodium/hydrogen exchanger-like protein 6/7
MKYTSENSEVTSETPVKIMKQFAGLGLRSVVIGVVFGLMSSYILKRYRFFSKSAIHESILIFCFGYLSYLFSELSHDSGIITLLTAGVVMAHYTWYNLSP